MRIRISTLCKCTIYLLFILDLNFFMISKTSISDRMFYMVGLSVIWAIYIFHKRQSEVYYDATKWIKRYGIIVMVMLFVHFIYAFIVNGVAKGVFLRSACYYLIFIFAFPLVYVFDYDDGTEKFWKMLNAIVVVWDISLIAQAVIYNSTGTIISPYLLDRGMYGNNIRNNMLRLEMRSMSHIMIIYNFDKCYNQEERGKFKYLLLAILGIFTMFYVEKTRGYYIAVLLSIAVLLICYNRKLRKFLFTFLLVIVVIVVLWKTNAIGNLYNSLFNDNNVTDATGLVRLRGYEIILEKLRHNPLWGFGFQTSGDWFSYNGIITYFNDNGFVGLLGQIGVWAVLVFGFMIVRFGYVIFDLFRKKSFRQATLFLGLYVYLIGTAPSLICYWNTTCLLCPVLWAVIEYEYANFKKGFAFDYVEDI